MDLLPEIWRLLVPYLTLEQLNVFRLVSRDHCEYTKSYEGPEFVRPYSLKLCFPCYPNIKCLDTELSFVDCTDFLSFAKLDELSINTRYLVRNTLFEPCVQLKALYLHSDYYESRNLDSTFKYLPQLTSLSLCNVHNVTDTAFNFAPQLEVLNISGRSCITSGGISTLKQLKKLCIDTPRYGTSTLIWDPAFEGLPIEELVLNNHNFLTDRGICHLKELRKVVCIKVKKVQGEGWNVLKKLQTIAIGSMIVQDVSNFKNAKTLSFQECRILGSWRGLWLKLEKLRIHNTTFEYPESIKTILCPRLRKIRIIKCRQMMDYENILCKTFGTKVTIRV